MREIKFRAWNKVYKKYVEINELEMGVKSLAIKFITPSGRTLYLEHGNSIILEQYTGLKDKNGVEIYEGDILKYTIYKEHALTFLVSFDKGSFIVEDREKIKKFLFGFDNNTIEVVGNIHENGDLIR